MNIHSALWNKCSAWLSIAVCSLFLVLVGNISPAHAELALTSGSNATTTPNVATSITGFQIVGNSASTTPVQLRVTHGTLSMTETSGLTFDGATSGAQVNFSGTVANINAALSTLKYTRSSTGSDTLEVSLVNKGEVFFTDNGHLYQFISGSFNWGAAKTAAEARTAYGATGYLATITSSEENNFVYARISGDGWLGATDAAVENTWLWATGPEAGENFYNGRGGAGGSVVPGYFDGWALGEPNDFSPGEDCGYMYASQDGEWNDFPCSATQGYVVEYGAPGALPTVTAANITITTADVPALTSLWPANGASAASTTTNLVMSFSKTVSVDTGNILIKLSSDNSTVETIDVTGAQVTGSGTNTITIDPALLDDSTSYYVIVPATAFLDASDNYFEGISTSTTWAFTTADETAPVISAVATSTVSSTSATVTWTTSENASTKVVYGIRTSYSSSTSETDTSSRVTSHSVDLSSLIACTTYNFAVVSRDATLNASTSTNYTFMTTGCTANTTPTSVTSTSITTSSGGSTSLTEGTRTINVSAPSNVTATSSSLVIQVSSMDNSAILEELGRPVSLPREVGSILFDVKAIIDNSTVLDTFDHPVTISYTYPSDDVSGLVESTIWLYHYHDGAWTPLDDCSVNTATNTITCTTPSFSLFALFGEDYVAPAAGSGGGGVPHLNVEPTALRNEDLRFSINNGAKTTVIPVVQLTFNSDERTVKGFAASLSPEFPLASIFPLSRNTFTLPSTPGTYTIYLKYYSVTGKPSDVLQQTIVYNPSGTTVSESVSSSPVANVVAKTKTLFARTLKLGSRGEDVKALQIFLNTNGFLISKDGPGSPGNETTTYGTLTVKAVMRFQEAYASTILKPLGLTKATGVFGSATLKLVNEMLGK